MNNGRGENLHVLVVPAWMPTTANPHSGPFIPFQAMAIQKVLGIKCGLVYRHSQRGADKDMVDKSCLEELDHVIVEAPAIPKINSLAISFWNKAYDRAYNSYVGKFGRPDIIHAHSYVGGFAALHLSVRTNTPFVLTEHATAFLTNRIRRGHKRVLRDVLTNAAQIVAVSTSLKKALQKYTRRNIQVVPNMYDENVFVPSSIQRAKTFRLVSVGNLIRRKRVDIAIDALRVLRTKNFNATLDIIGGGPLVDELKAYVNSLNMNEAVTFHGAKGSEEVARVLNSSDILISTSEIETFGISMIEAMACGLPVVSTPSLGPSDFITTECGIITSDFSASSIAEAVIRVGNAKLNRIAIADYTKSRFSSAVISGHMQEIYRSVLSR